MERKRKHARSAVMFSLLTSLTATTSVAPIYALGTLIPSINSVFRSTSNDYNHHHNGTMSDANENITLTQPAIYVTALTILVQQLFKPVLGRQTQT